MTLSEFLEAHGRLGRVLIDDRFSSNSLPSESDLDELDSCIEDYYAGEYESVEDYAREFIESTGTLDKAPRCLRNYIDYEKMGRDWVLGGDIAEYRLDGASHIFHGH